MLFPTPPPNFDADAAFEKNKNPEICDTLAENKHIKLTNFEFPSLRTENSIFVFKTIPDILIKTCELLFWSITQELFDLEF